MHWFVLFVCHSIHCWWRLETLNFLNLSQIISSDSDSTLLILVMLRLPVPHFCWANNLCPAHYWRRHHDSHCVSIRAVNELSGSFHNARRRPLLALSQRIFEDNMLCLNWYTDAKIIFIMDTLAIYANQTTSWLWSLCLLTMFLNDNLV